MSDSPTDAFKVDPERLQKELEYMRELIASDPDVRARFDANRDGQVDSVEWQAVERLVHERLRREEEERASYVGKFVGSKPGATAARVFELDVVPFVKPPPPLEGALPLAELINIGRLVLEVRKACREQRFTHEISVQDERFKELGWIGVKFHEESPTEIYMELFDPFGDSMRFEQRINDTRRDLYIVDSNKEDIADVNLQMSMLPHLFRIRSDGSAVRGNRQILDSNSYDVKSKDDVLIALIEGDFTAFGDSFNERIWRSRVTFSSGAKGGFRWGILAAAAILAMSKARYLRYIGPEPGVVFRLLNMFK